MDGVSHMSVDRPDTVLFTYDVVWELTEVPWTNRWDAYLTAESTNEKIHWFSITNSLMVVCAPSLLYILIKSMSDPLSPPPITPISGLI